MRKLYRQLEAVDETFQWHKNLTQGPIFSRHLEQGENPDF
jgi:hypothetical protein